MTTCPSLKDLTPSQEKKSIELAFNSDFVVSPSLLAMPPPPPDWVCPSQFKLFGPESPWSSTTENANTTEKPPDFTVSEDDADFLCASQAFEKIAAAEEESKKQDVDNDYEPCLQLFNFDWDATAKLFSHLFPRFSSIATVNRLN